MVDSSLGLVTFGGSIFSGFIRSQKLLTFLSGGRYYENFTVLRKVNCSKLKIDLREPRPQKADLYLRPKQGQST